MGRLDEIVTKVNCVSWLLCHLTTQSNTLKLFFVKHLSRTDCQVSMQQSWYYYLQGKVIVLSTGVSYVVITDVEWLFGLLFNIRTQCKDKAADCRLTCIHDNAVVWRDKHLLKMASAHFANNDDLVVTPGIVQLMSLSYSTLSKPKPQGCIKQLMYLYGWN